MALKSARLAGLRVDGTTVQGIRNWLNAAQNMRESEGQGQGRDWVGGRFAYRGSRGKGNISRRGLVTVMHPAGLMMRLLTGTAPDRREAYGTANLLLKLAPEARKEIPEEQMKALVAGFIKKNYMRWDSFTAEQRAEIEARAARLVTSYPRSVEEYIRSYYGPRWARLTEGQQAAVREQARQVVASYPRSVREYIDRYYRQWKTFSEEKREESRRYARAAIERRIHGPGFPRSIYFLYHSSLAMFQMGGRHWKVWNKHMKKALLEAQVRGGKDDGSWAPAGSGMCTCLGRTMATALGAMTLEVYYRYLRIYSK
jgi:hypothetical protein